MIRDAQTPEDGETLNVDVCIAGAGAAGIAMALDLEGQGLSVCLLEGGGLERDDEAQKPYYQGQEIGRYEIGLNGSRLRYLGGTTGHWGGWCRRLDPDVFAPRPWTGLSGWPIEHESLAPYFARAHDTCEIGANEWDLAAVAEREGLRALPLDPARVESALYQFSPPTRFGERYREALESAEDVSTYVNASLAEIVVRDDGDRVTGFRCQATGGGAFTVEASRYVLAMGGIENARMLLASNRTVPAGLGNQHGWVGSCFMEHPHLFSAAYAVLRGDLDVSSYTRTTGITTYDDDAPDGRYAAVRAALALPPAVRRDAELLAMGATLHGTSLDEAAGATGDVDADQLARMLREAPDGAQLVALHIRAEQVPSLHSRIFLNPNELDPLGVPKVVGAWNTAPVDFDSIGETLRRFGVELARAGVGRLWMELDDRGLFRPRSVNKGWHHMGTTRMAADPRDGVVDGDCRVHGVSNLYLAGSSVYSMGGYANPTLTLVALAHRLADHLAEELSS